MSGGHSSSRHARVIVTGGAGFIGSALVKELVEDGVHVMTIDKLTYAGRLENLDGVAGKTNHRFVHADIADRDAMRNALSEFRPQAIYHLAAESHVDRSIDGPIEFLRNNILGAGVMLDEVHVYWRTLSGDDHANFRFLQVSTDEVFGSLGSEGYFSSTSSYRPNSPYSASKAAADIWLGAYAATYGLPVLITHCGNNYGAHQLAEKLIPLMVLNGLEGRRLPVFGSGQNIRDWIHVQDHVAALRTVMAHGEIGSTYLIGARDEWTNLDLVAFICEILDELEPKSSHCPHRNLIEFVDDRPGHDFRYALDPSSTERLGWRAKRRVHEDLAAVVTWYAEHRDQLSIDVDASLRRRQGLERSRPD